MIRGAVCDMDGTLVDSMGMWSIVIDNYLEGLGIKPADDLREVTFAMTIPIAAQYLMDNYGLRDRGMTLEEVCQGISEPVTEFYRSQAQPKPGALALMKALHEAGIPIIIGTSTARDCVEMAMERLGMLPYVKKILSCEEVGATKEEPLLFHTAAELMGTKPEETWVFEDGLYSIRTATASGYRTVGFYDAASDSDWEEIQRIATISALDCAHLDLADLLAD